MKKVALLIVFFGFYFPAHQAISGGDPDGQFITGPQIGANSCRYYDVPIYDRMAQTFTAETTARLEQIRIWLSQGFGQPGNYYYGPGGSSSRVGLKLYEGHGVDGPLLGTSTSTVKLVPGMDSDFRPFFWRSWDNKNKPDLYLTKGRVYTFEVYYTAGNKSRIRYAQCYSTYPFETLYQITGSTQSFISNATGMAYKVITSPAPQPKPAN
ncbi:MAG: hypothetical protein AAFZ92_11335 [Pseudomonadota bacterium]